MKNPEIKKEKAEAAFMKALEKKVEELEPKKEETAEELKAKLEEARASLIEANNVIEFLGHELERQKELARVDELTGLKNRRAFEEELTRIAKEMFAGKRFPERREKFVIREASLIMLDIDNFKKINDTYGHKVGDSVLKGMAEVLKTHIRETDFVGRWGGEEMAVILLGAGEKEAIQKAEELRNALQAREFSAEGKTLLATASFGVAAFEEESAGDPEILVGMADDALYYAKETGKNKVCGFHDIIEATFNHVNQKENQ